MTKSEWYKHLFARIDQSIESENYFEAAFIAYGIIEDRLTSMMEQLGIPDERGVARKVGKIISFNLINLETEFGLKNWDGVKYTNLGLLGEVLMWGELYRNPLQHTLGDPRKYKALYGGFHVDNTRALAIEGRAISRSLSSAVMRYKRR